MVNESGDQAVKSGEAAEGISGGFLQSIVDIFIDPIKVFRRIDAGLAWWKPFILISVISIILGYLMVPITRHVTMLNESGVAEEQLETVVSFMEKGYWAAPVAVILGLLIVAAIAHLMIKIISPHSNFVKTLSLIAYCKLIYVVKDILYVVILRMKPLEDIESQADAQVSLSLSALFPDAGKYFSAFLENLGVFQIWYYILVIIGIATIFKMDRKKAVIPTLVLWVVILLGSFISIFFQGFGSRGMG